LFLSDRPARRSEPRVPFLPSRRSVCSEANEPTKWKSITRTMIPLRAHRAEAPIARIRSRCRSTVHATLPKLCEPPSRNSMGAKSNENPARRRPGPKPTPNDHTPSAATEAVAFNDAPRRPKPTKRSSLDWVKLQFDAEAPNLHVTAAHGYRTPKCSKPHAAYRRDRAATEAVALSLPPRGNPECPLSVPPKRPFQRPPQNPRAAEATRWYLPNTPATEATVAPPHFFSSAEASERPCNCETRR